MMHVIPAVVYGTVTGSERRVSDLLKGVEWGSGAFALHSLNLAEPEHKRWGELDFVIAGPAGLLVVEVKGGEVSLRDGIWSYSDRAGRVVNRSHSPLVQAKDGYFNLMSEYLEEHFGRDFLADVPTGFCAVLAGVKRRDLRPLLGGPEFPPVLWGTKDDIHDSGALARFLNGVAAHWATHPRQRRTTLSREKLLKLRHFLRPNFERIRSLGLSSQVIRAEQVQLTDDQYKCLDHWEGAKRILVTGPAGCGKTFIAAEIVRRAAVEGESVVMVVPTKKLAARLRRELGRFGHCVISHTEIVGRVDSRASLLVVDEGQLFLAAEDLRELGALVEGGWEHGRWAWFGDPSFQSRTQEKDDSVVGLDTLRRLSSVQPRLTFNCRNTREVMSSTELAAGVRMGHVAVKGHGPVVAYDELKAGTAIESSIGEVVSRWLDQEVPPSEITVLLLPNTVLDHSALSGQVGAQCEPMPDDLLERSDSLWVEGIDGFRGLESPFVILAGRGNDLSDGKLQRLLYLGMSRANVGLTLCVDEDTLARVRGFALASADRSATSQ